MASIRFCLSVCSDNRNLACDYINTSSICFIQEPAVKQRHLMGRDACMQLSVILLESYSEVIR